MGDRLGTPGAVGFLSIASKHPQLFVFAFPNLTIYTNIHLSSTPRYLHDGLCLQSNNEVSTAAKNISSATLHPTASKKITLY